MPVQLAFLACSLDREDARALCDGAALIASKRSDRSRGYYSTLERKDELSPQQ